MNLRIYHTGDLHIGMRFTHYPETIRDLLGDARIQVLENMVADANQRQCHLLVVSGDLFDHQNVAVKTVSRVQDILSGFEGALVLVLPGNHDFDDGMQNIWSRFGRTSHSRIHVAGNTEAIPLNYFGIPAVIYPCPCDQKHSSQNRLAWIPPKEQRPDAVWHIGVAHGALQHLSPDMERRYFNMTEHELVALDMDLWLMGHTHKSYPTQEEIRGQRIFNAGTPEPDGMDCLHDGGAWLIELEDQKAPSAWRIKTGMYRFMDESVSIHGPDDIRRLSAILADGQPEKTLLRLTLSGRIREDDRIELEGVRQLLEKKMLYLEWVDHALQTKVTREMVEREFTKDSFPHAWLMTLLERQDDAALQIAYEMIREVNPS